MADAYYADRLAKPVAYPATIAQRLKPIRATFGAGPVSAITANRVRAYIAKRRSDGVKDATIDAELRALRQVLKFGEREGWIDRAPIIQSPGGNVPRQRFLTDAEIDALRGALEHPETSPHIRLFVMLALATAQRGGALRELTWDRIDFERGIIWAAPARSRLKQRVNVPMTEALAAHLRLARRAAQTQWVVEWRGQQVAAVRTGFRALLRRAGLVNVTVHDLRRTAASLALRRGASFAEVAALLGDDESVVRRHYAQFEPDYLRRTVELMESGGGTSAEPGPQPRIMRKSDPKNRALTGPSDT